MAVSIITFDNSDEKIIIDKTAKFGNLIFHSLKINQFGKDAPIATRTQKIFLIWLVHFVRSFVRSFFWLDGKHFFGIQMAYRKFTY